MKHFNRRSVRWSTTYEKGDCVNFQATPVLFSRSSVISIHSGRFSLSSASQWTVEGKNICRKQNIQWPVTSKILQLVRVVYRCMKFAAGIRCLTLLSLTLSRHTRDADPVLLWACFAVAGNQLCFFETTFQFKHRPTFGLLNFDEITFEFLSFKFASRSPVWFYPKKNLLRMSLSISSDLQGRILAYGALKWSRFVIVKELKKLNFVVGHSTVSRVLQNHNNGGIDRSFDQPKK